MSNPSVPLTGERADLLETLAAHRGFLRHTVAGPHRRPGPPADRPSASSPSAA